jgi:hypothetical protein
MPTNYKCLIIELGSIIDFGILLKLVLLFKKLGLPFLAFFSRFNKTNIIGKINNSVYTFNTKNERKKIKIRPSQYSGFRPK